MSQVICGTHLCLLACLQHGQYSCFFKVNAALLVSQGLHCM